jgi:hypothetical protein
VEKEAPSTNKHVAKESDEEYPVMAMLPAAYNALDRQVDEEEVGQRIDNFCRIWGRIVVLEFVSIVELTTRLCDTLLHTNSA